MSKYIAGHRWFNCLEDGLLSFAPMLRKNNPHSPQLIICMNRLNSKQIENRWFGYFTSYLELDKFLRNYHQEPSFFEVVLGTNQQKMRFDIDVKSGLPLTEIISQLVQSTMLVLGDLGYPLDPETDIMIFTSCNSTKQSAHIVIVNHAFLSHEHCSQLYRMIISRLDSQYHDDIDSAVYKSVQQFRLLGSTKIGKNRPKVFLPQWLLGNKLIISKLPEPIRSEEHERLMILELSLLSWTVGMKVVSLPAAEVQPPPYTPIGTLIAVDRDQLVSFCPPEFTIHKQKGNIIELRRNKNIKSACLICQRCHEAENAFLVLTPRGVFFNCWRNKQDTHPRPAVWLGTLSSYWDNVPTTESSHWNQLEITTATDVDSDVDSEASESENQSDEYQSDEDESADYWPPNPVPDRIPVHSCVLDSSIEDSSNDPLTAIQRVRSIMIPISNSSRPVSQRLPDIRGVIIQASKTNYS